MSTAGYFFNEKPPLGLRVAQAVGITASAFLFGQNVALTVVAIPTVLKAPAPLAARQWRTVYDIGMAFGRPLAVVSSVALGYVAWQQDPSSLAFKLNVAAAALVPSIIPFTIAFIVPTNKKLFEKEASLASSSLEDKAVEAGVASGETTHALIDKWGTLNLARAALVGVGVVLAVWAAVDKREVVGFKEVTLATGANRLS